jgi:phage tail-like protein
VTPARIRHFLLDRRAGWRGEPLLADAIETDDGVLRLQPLPGAPQPLTDATGTFGGLTDPIGVAAGADGTVVILDRAGTRVLRYDECDQTFAALPCILDPARPGFSLSGARDLAITRNGDVAIADTGNHRVLILVGAGLGVRAVAGPWDVPNGSAWEPWGIAAHRRGLVVSDHANGLIHFLDGCGHWLGATDGSGPGVPPLAKPTAIAADARGEIYVLQEGSTKVRVLDGDGAFVAEVGALNDRRHGFCPVAVAVSPGGGLCVASSRGRLCLFCCREGRWSSAGETAVDPPLAGIAFDRDGAAVLVAGDRACLVRLRNGAGYPKLGRFVTAALDSELTGCRWHRIALRADIPEGTAVRVDTLTAEAPLSPAELASVPAARWATGQLAGSTVDGHWDCLVRSDPGRYLWLSLSMTGDGVGTPQIDDVEVWFPRHTSVEYLPEAFASDPAGGDFLQRFSAILDRQRQTVTGELDRISALFDPMAVPANADGSPDFLGWLAGWVGMAVDEQLPVRRRRLLVREAASLYRASGTPEGVRRFVSLFCGVEVRVLEHYRLRRWAIAGRARLGDTSQLFGPAIVKRLQLGEFSEIGSFALVDRDDPRRDPFFAYASQFSLLLLVRPDDRLLALAARVAEMAKPAHTEVDIEAIEPRQRVGIQSTVGLDTVIGEIPEPARAGQGRLGHGFVVGPDPRLGGRPLAQIGVRARIGVNTGLE